VRDALRRLRPRSIQARVALAIGIALLAVFLVVQVVFVGFVQARARDEVEAALHQQADSIARQIERSGLENAAASAREAQRYIGDARLVVRVSGVAVHWNVPVSDLEASATARRGDLEVLLERPDPSAGLFTDWVFVALLAIGLVGTGGLIWGLAVGVGSRLRASVRDLADSAEAVTRGHLDVRVAETDDELGRLAQAFNRMTARLEAADVRQREFLADVAHELRTPVTAIEGFAQALSDGTAATPEDRAESADFIRAEAARLRELVRDLQQLTWLDLDPPVETADIDLMDAGRDAVARLAADARAAGVSLHPPEGHLIARADPAHVETILANLITNAIRATPPGGFVHLHPVAAPGQAGIAVSDTGIGIPPEHIPYIFDRLYRVQSGRQRPGGSGLGLSIVRRLATLLGGRVTVRSVPGTGSTFTLWLPARAVAPPRRPRVGSTLDQPTTRG
jgi:two-component system, OmpR family, sensor histidine kinase BaeS